MDSKLQDTAISETVVIKRMISNMQYYLFVMRDKDCIKK